MAGSEEYESGSPRDERAEHHPEGVPRCRFWYNYEIPFEYDVAIKVRRSGLLRGSSGTGQAADTVYHLHVKEPFSEGRLSRDEDSYLCEKGSLVNFDGREERHSEDGEVFVPPVTCDTCLDRMARWEVDDD